MSAGMKAVLGVVFSFLFVFTAVGYASLADDLYVSGNVDLVAPQALFITDVALSTGSDGSLDQRSFLATTLNSSVTVLAGKTTRLSITVLNNTTVEYGYDAVIRPVADGQNQVYTNEEIGYYLHGLVRPHLHDGVMIEGVTRIPAGSYYTFEIEFYHTEEGTAAFSEQLTSVLNFIFKPFDEIDPDKTSAAVEGALAKFKEILNTPAEHAALLDEMEDNYNPNAWLASPNTLTYVGTVVGSSEEDSATLRSLFDGQLKINLNNKDTDVTIMIKRENVDGNESTGSSYTYEDRRGNSTTVNGCEMTLYMTSDPYKDENGRWLLQNGDDVTVYAAVFRLEPDGVWHQLGDMYKGQTTVNGYEAPWYSGSGSFNTDDWHATETYYNVTAGSRATIEAITAAYLKTLQ